MLLCCLRLALYSSTNHARVQLTAFSMSSWIRAVMGLSRFMSTSAVSVSSLRAICIDSTLMPASPRIVPILPMRPGPSTYSRMMTSCSGTKSTV